MKLVYRSIVTELRNMLEDAARRNRKVNHIELSKAEMAELMNEVRYSIKFLPKEPDIGEPDDTNYFMGVRLVVVG